MIASANKVVCVLTKTDAACQWSLKNFHAALRSDLGIQ